MTETLKKYSRASSFGAFAAAPMYPGAPRIAFGPEGSGSGGGEGGEGGDGAGEGEGAGDGEGKNDGEGTGAVDDDKNKDKNAGKAGESEDKKLLREVMEKKGEIKDLKAALAKFDGIDPDAVRALLAEKRTAELAAEEAAGNFARVKEMMVEEHNKALKALQDQVAELNSTIETKDGTINELTVGRSFSESTFIGEDLVLTKGKARQLYSGHFDVVDGKIVGYDKPKGAKDRTEIVGADGKPVSFEDAIKRIVDADPEKDALYRDKSKAGAGSATRKVEGAADDKNKNKDTGLRGAARILAGLNAQRAGK